MNRFATEGGFEARPVLLCGNRSTTRVSGLTVAFDMLTAGFECSGRPHVIIDKGAIGAPKNVGAFAFVRAIKTVSLLLRFWFVLPRVSTVYNTVAPSRLGFLRDAFMIWPSCLLRRRIVLHLFGGGYGQFFDAQPGWMQRIIRATLSRADKIVVEGHLLREQFSFVEGVDQKLVVVPNGLPDGVDVRDVRPKEAPRSGQPVRLLYMSNMIPSKGYLDVLEASRLLRDTWDRPFVCDFCGAFVRTSADDRDISAAEAAAGFDRLVSTHELDDVVRYHGLVRGREKESLLRQAHLFLLPTNYPWEGQPFSIIEALAFGTPIIATRFRGIPEQVIHGHNGFFVEAGDAVGLATAIRHALRDELVYTSLSEQALAHYREQFTQQAHLERMMAAIDTP